MRIKSVPNEIHCDPSHLHVARNAANKHHGTANAGFLFRVSPLIAVLCVLLTGTPARADQLEELAKKAGIRTLTEGDSTNDSQKRAAASIPLNQLTPANRQRAQKIIEDCSQFRHLPSLQYSVDEAMYRYLLQHPDVAVSTWRVMGISRFEMWQTGPQEYEAKAVDGSEGLADILYSDASQMLFICEGTYHNILMPKPLEASALIWFRSTSVPNAEGTHVVTQKADVFVRFPSAGFSTVAKMLAPVTNGMMDRNVYEISLYGSMMSRAVRDEPDWVVQVADQMEGVLPQRKGELIAVARQPRKVSARGTTQQGSAPSVDRNMIMSPQLLFFDPPKDGQKTVAGTAGGPTAGSSRSNGGVATLKVMPAGTTSGPPVSVTPASKTSRYTFIPRVSSASTEKPKSQSDDEFELQPAVPPTGPTATGPVGSGPPVGSIQ